MPEVGRFISPDTIVPEPANPQSFNRYSYVRNNPVNFTDPSGHMECSGVQGECGYPTPGRTPTKNTSSGASNGSGSSIVKKTLGDLFDFIAIENPRVEPQPNSANLTEWLVGQMSQTAQSPLVQLLHALWMAPAPVGNQYLVLTAWARLVATGAIWDFKSDIWKAELPFGVEDLIQLGNHFINYQAVANIFYGFIGRQIGMSEFLLQGGAGLAQIEHGLDHWNDNITSYPAGIGDQPFDAWAIGFGFALHNQFGNDVNSLTVTAFTSAFDAYISTNLPPLGP